MRHSIASPVGLRLWSNCGRRQGSADGTFFSVHQSSDLPFSLDGINMGLPRQFVVYSDTKQYWVFVTALLLRPWQVMRDGGSVCVHDSGEITIETVLSVFTDTPFSAEARCRASRAVDTVKQASCRILLEQYNVKSSAKEGKDVPNGWAMSARSDTYMLYKRGPRTLPCGTPFESWKMSDTKYRTSFNFRRVCHKEAFSVPSCTTYMYLTWQTLPSSSEHPCLLLPFMAAFSVLLQR